MSFKVGDEVEIQSPYYEWNGRGIIDQVYSSASYSDYAVIPFQGRYQGVRGAFPAASLVALGDLKLWNVEFVQWKEAHGFDSNGVFQVKAATYDEAFALGLAKFAPYEVDLYVTEVVVEPEPDPLEEAIALLRHWFTWLGDEKQKAFDLIVEAARKNA